MSIEKLFNHRAVVYRDASATDPAASRDEYGDPIADWNPLTAPAGMNCRPDQNWSGTLQDSGPGEQQDGNRRWFLHRSFDVQKRDVLAITEGQEAPINLRILSVTPCATRRRLHHFEVNIEVYEGALLPAPAVTS